MAKSSLRTLVDVLSGAVLGSYWSVLYMLVGSCYRGYGKLHLLFPVWGMGPWDALGSAVGC